MDLPVCTTPLCYCGGISRPNTPDLGSARRQPSSLDAGTRTTDVQPDSSFSHSSHHSLLAVTPLTSASISSSLDETIRTADHVRRDIRPTRGWLVTRTLREHYELHMHLSEVQRHLASFTLDAAAKYAISIRLTRVIFRCNLRTPASHYVRQTAPAGECTHFCSEPWDDTGDGRLGTGLHTGKEAWLSICSWVLTILCRLSPRSQGSSLVIDHIAFAIYIR
jgi:hypothetical protein